MKEVVESIEKQISADKEIINVLPRKGIKSIKSLLDNIDEMTEKYEKTNKELLREIEQRYNKLADVSKNKELPMLEEEILKLDIAIKNTDTRSSYEKMRLDKIEYNINGYYKRNLERLNQELLNCVKQFERVGIKLTADDFYISEYAHEYMKALLQEAYEGEINSEKIKDTFEKIYWTCSEIVSHLYVNIRCLYDENKEEIERYYENRSKEIMEKLNSTPEQVENTKTAIIKRKKKIENTDRKIILDQFLEGKLNINDFKEQSYNKIYAELISKDVTSLTQKEKDEMNEIIESLNENLQEYFKFTEYKFLYDGVLKIRADELAKSQKEKGQKIKKTEYDQLKESIEKTTNNILKINNKINKQSKGLFASKNINNKKISAIILQRNGLILELKRQYMKLDDEIIKRKIMKNIDDTSSMLDVLKIGSHYYGFMAKEIIKKYPEITDKELEEMAEKIRDYITFTNFVIINHIKISDSKELSIIIKDKYKLFGMDVSKENFNDDNIEDLIKKVKIISNYNNLLKSNYTVENINYILIAKELLNKVK